MTHRQPIAEESWTVNIPPGATVLHADEAGVIYQDAQGQQHQLQWQHPLPPEDE